MNDISQSKICTKCKLSKPLKDFRNDKYRLDGKTLRCRDCLKAAGKAAGPQVRPPAYHERKAARYQERKEEDPEGLRAIWRRANKTYKAKHPGKILAHNRTLRGYWRARAQASKLLYPDRSAAQQERRRARRQGFPDTWTAAEQAFMLEYWQYSCAVCGNPKGLFWTLANDHWIPLALPQCPGTVAANMIPLCHGAHGCNNSKNASEPHAWLVKRFGARRATKIEKAIASYFLHVVEAFKEVL